MGGTNELVGRVEICNNNMWGTVCQNSWGVTDAQVACRDLGFSPDGGFEMLLVTYLTSCLRIHTYSRPTTRTRIRRNAKSQKRVYSNFSLTHQCYTVVISHAAIRGCIISLHVLKYRRCRTENWLFCWYWSNLVEQRQLCWE